MGTIYAVYKGYDRENKQLIEKKTYTKWGDMKDFVVGISIKKDKVAPIYKKCYTEEEVESFFKEHDEVENTRNKSHLDFPKGTYHLYVDGSFAKDQEKYSSGLVLLKDDEVVLEYKKASDDNRYKEYYQIPGELKATMLGLSHAVKTYDIKHIVIYHDYMGVKTHATGDWDRDTQLSVDYYNWFQAFKEKYNHIKIEFIKVDAHKGNKYNERADVLAKEALGIL